MTAPTDPRLPGGGTPHPNPPRADLLPSGRPHGRAAYSAGECGCLICRSANARYEAERLRDHAYGRERLVDAAPVRAHLRALRAEGMGRRQVAILSGVAPSMVEALLHGRRGKQVARVRPATAQALLAVRPGLDALADHQPVDATGTVRRLQALVAVGWPQAELARRLDITGSNFVPLITADRVTAHRARQVRDLYAGLSGALPPQTTPRERAAVRRARDLATARGWHSPVAWDGALIDDPTATPFQEAASA